MLTTIILSFLFVMSLLLVVLVNRKKTRRLVNSLNGGAQLIDVRTKEEWAQGAIDGAIHLPLDEILKASDKLDPEQHYLTYCSHGVRSIKAQKILKKQGVKNVYNGGAMNKLQKVIDDSFMNK